MVNFINTFFYVSIYTSKFINHLFVHFYCSFHKFLLTFVVSNDIRDKILFFFVLEGSSLGVERLFLVSYINDNIKYINACQVIFQENLKKFIRYFLSKEADLK